jgi:Tfp pilus assembly protein PilX
MKQKKGVALLWAMITAVVIMLIASVVANVVIKESRMTVDVENSTRAYAAAQSGVEWAKWYIDQNCKNPSDCNAVINQTIDLTEGEVAVRVEKIVDFADHTKDYFDIQSTGQNPGAATVTRKLSYKYKGASFDIVSNKSIADNINNINTQDLHDSFSYMFDYWEDPTTANDDTVSSIGFKNNSSNQYIAVRIKHAADGSRKLNVVYRSKSDATEQVGLSVPLEEDAKRIVPSDVPEGWSTPYISRIKVDYIKNTTIQVTFMKATGNALPENLCTSRFSVNLRGKEFNHFSRHMFTINGSNASLTYPVPTNFSDDVLKLTTSSGAVFGYLDNFGIRR